GEALACCQVGERGGDGGAEQPTPEQRELDANERAEGGPDEAPGERPRGSGSPRAGVEGSTAPRERRAGDGQGSRQGAIGVLAAPAGGGGSGDGAGGAGGASLLQRPPLRRAWGGRRTYEVGLDHCASRAARESTVARRAADCSMPLSQGIEQRHGCPGTQCPKAVGRSWAASPGP